MSAPLVPTAHRQRARALGEVKLVRILLYTATLLLNACGGSDSSQGGTGGSPTAPTPPIENASVSGVWFVVSDRSVREGTCLADKPTGEPAAVEWEFEQSSSDVMGTLKFQGRVICAYRATVSGRDLVAFIDRARSPNLAFGATCYRYPDSCSSPSRRVLVEVETNTPAFTCRVTEPTMRCEESLRARVTETQSGLSLGTMSWSGVRELRRASPAQ
jgi:hypothetical protein